MTNLNQNVLDGVWHHLAVVWEAAVNKWWLRIDGEFKGAEVYSQWLSIHIPEGDLIIGQNLNPANTFMDSFVGKITSFNMWNYKWEESAIVSLAESCGTQPGNVFQWHNIRKNLHGEVKVEHPSSCM